MDTNEEEEDYNIYPEDLAIGTEEEQHAGVNGHGQAGDQDAAAWEEVEDEDLYGDVGGDDVRRDDHSGMPERQQPKVQAPKKASDSPTALARSYLSKHVGAHAVPLEPSTSKPAPVALASTEPAEGCGIYVAGLTWWTTDAELESLCSQFGAVKRVRFFEDKANGKSKGYALVEFVTPDGAAAAKDGLVGHAINGQRVVVTMATAASLRALSGGPAQPVPAGAAAGAAQRSSKRPASPDAAPSAKRGRDTGAGDYAGARPKGAMGPGMGEGWGPMGPAGPYPMRGMPPMGGPMMGGRGPMGGWMGPMPGGPMGMPGPRMMAPGMGPMGFQPPLPDGPPPGGAGAMRGRMGMGGGGM